MVKTIKKGNVPTAQIECPNCGSLLEYGNADLWEKINNYLNTSPMWKSYSIRCPECNVEIDVNWVVNTKDKD